MRTRGPPRNPRQPALPRDIELDRQNANYLSLAPYHAAMLDGVLPALDDVPAEMQAELVEMTWLDDVALQAIAGAVLSDADQRRMLELSGRDGLSDAEQEALNGLRDRYGKATLRKARALALLSVRSGKGLLAQAA